MRGSWKEQRAWKRTRAGLPDVRCPRIRGLAKRHPLARDLEGQKVQRSAQRINSSNVKDEERTP